MAVYLGIDVGGTNIKIGLIGENHQFIDSTSIRTQDQQESQEEIVQNLMNASIALLQANNLQKDDVAAIGMGVPGTILNKTGLYVFAGNLPFRNFNLREAFQKEFNCPSFFGNDANLAALAESRLGAGNGARDSVVLTLGTGMGAGIIINNRVYSGFNETGCEYGHIIMQIDGEPCTCGRKGCFEAYVSATALIRQTKEAIEKNPDSILAKEADSHGKVSGRTAFIARKNGCEIANQVVLQYTDYLAKGIANVINSYMPEVVILGGGISHEGQELIDLCADKAIEESFIHGDITPPRIVLAVLGNQAGMLGAALFAEDCLADSLIAQ